MSEMIERVARAIVRRRMGASASMDDRWKDWTGEAEAAIAAMREPTEAMLGTVEDPGDFADGNGALSSSAARSIWQIMVEEALK